MIRISSLAVMALMACAAPPPMTQKASVQAETPDIRGVIVRITEDGRYLVERSDGSEGSGKVVVRVTAATALSAEGRPATVADLRPGLEVSVWLTGPILKSYPPQATASRVVLHMARKQLAEAD